MNQLLRSQKNSIFELIVNEGLSPANFYFYKTNSHIQKNTKIEVLKVKESKFYFQFDRKSTSEGYFIFYSPTGSKGLYRKYWGDVLRIFTKWLKLIKQEVLQPDKWKDYYNNFKNANFTTGEFENTQFTFQETEQVKQAVSFLKEELKTIGLKQDSLKLLNEKLDYIAEKSKTMGKVDWKNLFVGLMFSTIFQLSIPSDISVKILKIIQDVFASKILFLLGA